MKAARPRSEGEVSCGNTGIDSNLGQYGGATLQSDPTIILDLGGVRSKVVLS